MPDARQGLAGPHLVRYGIAADQKYLVSDLLDSYDQLVVNARMVAHMAAGLALFITQRTRNKPYFIDPETHAFQHDVDYLRSISATGEVRVKRSVDKLVDAYGDPVKTVMEREESILPEDFKNDRERNDFCERVIRFQLRAIAERVQETEYSEYYEFLKEKGIVTSDDFRPSFVVAPYFCMDTNTVDEWLGVNVACARDCETVAEGQGAQLAVQMVIDQSVLADENCVMRIAENYSSLHPYAFLLWVDSFSEHQVPEELLKQFARLAQALKGSGSQVINLYGGYFSILLRRTGILDGVTHSLGFGEDRPILPVGGGIPTAKFYLPTLHMRLSPREALRAVRGSGGMQSVEAFHGSVCNCRQCESTISSNPETDFGKYMETRRKGGREIPLPETKDNCVRHYMWCKEREYKEQRPVPEVLTRLREAGERLKRHLGIENTGHCARWASVVEGILGNAE